MKETEARDREIYRGTLEQRKAVWNLWAEGHTANQIAGQLQPSLAVSTIYKWVREFKNLSAQSLMAIYEEGPPELIIDKWKSYNIWQPEKIGEFDELRKKKRIKSNTFKNQKDSENDIIKPPKCFEKNKWGCCRNAGLRSDCGACYYLRIGRTREEIDRLIAKSLSLPVEVEKAKKAFNSQRKDNIGI